MRLLSDSPIARNALFISFKDENLSFAETKVRIDETAEEFRNSGIRANDIVALAPDNTIKSIISILALVSIGSDIVLLNPQLKEEERTYLLEIAEVNYLVGTSIKIVNEVSKSGRGGESQIILFTSGTSGSPKGVILTLENFKRNALASKKRLGLEVGDRWLLNLPVYHVGGLAILFRAVYLNLSIVIHDRFDIKKTSNCIKRGDVNIVSFVPTMLHRLLKNDIEPLKKLKVLLLGGAKPNSDLLDICIREKLRIFTTYGMTESCSQIATATPEMVYQDRTTVGYPLDEMEIRITHNGEECVQGCEGSIEIRGSQVFVGYIGEQPLSGFFTTGDTGYIDEKGELHVLGRADETIITGGENVHPLEIEEVISQYRGVQKLCVFGVEDHEWGQRIEVAIESNEEIMTKELKKFLRERLPAFKIPKRFHFFKLPLTTSGKVNRSQVKQMVELSK